MSIVNLAQTDDPFGLLEIVITSNIQTSNNLGAPITNVYHYRRFSGAGPVDKASLVGAFLGTGAPGLLVYQDSLAGDDSPVFAAKCRFALDPTDGYGGDDSIIVNPGISGDRLPSYNCVTAQFRTGVRGREYRGSKHFAPIAESDTSRDQLTDAAMTGHWNAAVTGLATQITGADSASGSSYIPVVLSRKLSQLIVAPCTAVVADVAEVVINRPIGTVKHRKERRAD